MEHISFPKVLEELNIKTVGLNCTCRGSCPSCLSNVQKFFEIQEEEKLFQLSMSNTSSSAWLGTHPRKENLPGRPEGESNRSRHGGLSLALADFRARSNVMGRNGESSLPRLPNIIHDAVSPHASSKDSSHVIDGSYSDLPVSTISEENSKTFTSRCFFCNQKMLRDSEKIIEYASELERANDPEKRAKTNAELEAFMVALINGDSTAEPPTLLSEETYMNMIKQTELPEAFTCLECSKMRNSEYFSMYERGSQKAPPEFYNIRWNREFREPSKAKFIDRNGGMRSEHWSRNALQRSHPIEVPKLTCLPGDLGLQQSRPIEVPKPSSLHGDSASGLQQSHPIEVPKPSFLSGDSASANGEYSYAYSMTDGVGRTLKGRDQLRVRNHVLRLTGFLEE